MNANPAALTVRTHRRLSPPRRAFASFFQARITLERRKKKRRNKCQKDNTLLGENYCVRRSKSRGECSKLTPPFTNSFGNALLAREQCTRRKLQPGPLNTYNGWLERKRQVRKGEKGITLCMPMPFERTAQTDGVQEETAEPQTCYGFRFLAYWFVLAQTEGEETYIPPIPGFDIETALRNLNITRAPFDEMNGNIQGFANEREVAINPLAAQPHKTTLHEIAHILLG